MPYMPKSARAFVTDPLSEKRQKNDRGHGDAGGDADLSADRKPRAAHFFDLRVSEPRFRARFFVGHRKSIRVDRAEHSFQFRVIVSHDDDLSVFSDLRDLHLDLPCRRRFRTVPDLLRDRESSASEVEQ